MRTLILTACATALLGASSLAPASAAVMTTTSKTTQKNLHGKDREKFRRACMKTAK